MNTEEMLDFAAVAVGRNIIGYDAEGSPVIKIPGGGAWRWNPLSEDTDTFELMCDLKINITFHQEFVQARINYVGASGTSEWLSSALYKDHYDVQDATAYAAVSVAANVGKYKKEND